MPERDGIRHVTKTYFLTFIHIIGCCKYICQKFRPKNFVKKSLIFPFICMVNHQLVIKRGIKGSRVSNPPALMARDADYMTFLVLSQSHPAPTRSPLENCHWQQVTTLIFEVPYHASNSSGLWIVKGSHSFLPLKTSQPSRKVGQKARTFPILVLSQKVWEACKQQALSPREIWTIQVRREGEQRENKESASLEGWMVLWLAGFHGCTIS